MNALYWTIRNFVECPREDGQTLVEYALIIALVAVLLVAALILLRGGIENVFNEIQTELDNAIS